MTPNIGRAIVLGAALVVAAGGGANRATAFADASANQQAAERRVVRVTAERFTFTPSRIVVNPGETIELRLTSDDTTHGFRINGTDVNTVIPKRGMPETSVTLTAPAPGRYTIECTRMCGAGHNFMRGELVVRAPATGARQP